VTVAVRLAGPLRPLAGGADRVSVALPDAAATVAGVLDALESAHPALIGRVRDERGVLRRHVNVFVAGEECRAAGGLDAPVPDGAEVVVLPAVSGG
jgi:molybdopterin synthase sulfur carrier subunit